MPRVIFEDDYENGSDGPTALWMAARDSQMRADGLQSEVRQSGTVSRQPDSVRPAPRNPPVVRWTAARDAMNFRYDFLENVKTTTLLRATPESGTWNHHQHIIYFEGVFYAVWDTQIKDENAAGQHGVLRRSTDQGKTWTPVEKLFPPSARNVPAADPYPETRFQTFSGFAVIDGVLYAVTDVAEWTSAGKKKVKPRRKIGRMCRSIESDGTLGPIFWLLPTAPKPVQGFPSFPAGAPALVTRIEEFFRQPGQEIQLDFAPRAHPDSDDNHVMAEPVPSYQLDDGTWVRLYRDSGARGARTLKEEEETKSRRNYASFSFDGGQTWTTPTRTSFPDACARSNAGKLPDGQVYVINNVLPLATKQGGRSLLAISLARDGLNFDRMAVIRFLPPPPRYEGRSKAVGYAYPHSVIVGEHLWVIYSVNKEDIEIARIPLSELEALK
ncbi:MAG: exo-alpha-sialidase [Planctomycetota bacterium]